MNITRINSADTHVVNSGLTKLYKLIVGGAVLSTTITIYDNTQALASTIVFQATHPAVLNSDQYELDFGGVTLKIGLTVVTSGADDISLVWEGH